MTLITGMNEMTEVTGMTRDIIIITRFTYYYYYYYYYYNNNNYYYYYYYYWDERGNWSVYDEWDY